MIRVILFAGLIAGLGATALPPDARCVAADVATLQDQLEKGLKARLPEDFVYVNYVVQLVDQGTLSRELVLGTFQWVRKEKRGKTYLIPYFREALRRRAAQKGILI